MTRGSVDLGNHCIYTSTGRWKTRAVTSGPCLPFWRLSHNSVPTTISHMRCWVPKARVESRAVSKAGSRARGLGELGTGVPGILGPVPALFSLGPGFLVEEGQKSPAPTPRLPMAWEHTVLVSDPEGPSQAWESAHTELCGVCWARPSRRNLSLVLRAGAPVPRR